MADLGLFTLTTNNPSGEHYVQNILEVSLNQSLQESIDEAITELNNLNTTQEERDHHLALLYK
jgi:hypothetical protein